MRVLGLETGGQAVSAALVGEEGVLAEAWLGKPQQHCREIIALVDWCLDRAQVTLAEVEALAVSLGPGSFTGLRVGLAAAKAMALALGKRLVGVPTLEALAASAWGFPGLVCPLIFSRPGEVYAAVLRLREDLSVEYVVSPAAWPVGELLGRLPSGEEEVLLIGEAAALVAEAQGRRLPCRVKVGPPTNGRLLASQVASLGRKKIMNGGEDNPLALEPLYLRPPGITLRGG